MAARSCWPRSAGCIRGCAISSPMAATRATNCAAPWRGSDVGGLRSSSDPTAPRASKSCHEDGSSREHLHGSADAAGSLRIARPRSKAPLPGFSSPTSEPSLEGSQDLDLVQIVSSPALTGSKPTLEPQGKKGARHRSWGLSVTKKNVIATSNPRLSRAKGNIEFR